MSIFGGVDTTRAQLGFLVDIFIANPDQWRALKENPDLAGAAVEESGESVESIGGQPANMTDARDLCFRFHQAKRAHQR